MVLHEETVAQYLRGERTIGQLQAEVMSAAERVNKTRERIRIADMSDEFVVTCDMLIRLCDAASVSAISPAALRIVAFAIVASDRFTWNDDLVGEVLHDWAAPEVNLTLSPENVERFKSWLSGDAAYPQRASALAAETQAVGRVISELEKVTVVRGGGPDDVIAHVCRLAEETYRTGRAPQELARDTQFALNRQRVTARAIRRWLRRHQETIEWWERWSQDKRTSSGWYFVRRLFFAEVGWYDASRGKQQVRRFISPSAACAQFVIRELSDLTDAS